MSRDLVKEVLVDAPPDVVWRALTEADELIRWFPVEARVNPGLGGSIWISWGEGASGEAPITAWEPNRHFQWTESRGPVKMAIDFHLETRDGGTVVRLVQSGFGDGPDWDGEYHMVDGGWSYFLANLKWSLERHRGLPRDLIGLRDPVALDREDLFRRLCGLAQRLEGVSLFERPATGQAAFTIPALADAILFVEIEPGAPTSRGGFWLSTYGLAPERLAALRARVTREYRQALELPVEA